MTEPDQKLAVEVLNIFQARYREVDVCFLEITTLMSWLNAGQQSLVTKLVDGVEDSVSTAQKICQPPSQPNAYQRQFVRLPGQLDDLFGKMSLACFEATGSHPRVASAYRSLAYQAVIFLRELYDNNFNWDKTTKSVMLPGKSEHQDPLNPALDLGAGNQLATDGEYMSTIYPWLKVNARSFGFYETYPQGNPKMIWEPWHWRASAAVFAKPA